MGDLAVFAGARLLSGHIRPASICLSLIFGSRHDRHIRVAMQTTDDQFPRDFSSQWNYVIYIVGLPRVHPEHQRDGAEIFEISGLCPYWSRIPHIASALNLIGIPFLSVLRAVRSHAGLHSLFVFLVVLQPDFVVAFFASGVQAVLL
jgi:hypothetical protein